MADEQKVVTYEDGTKYNAIVRDGRVFKVLDKVSDAPKADFSVTSKPAAPPSSFTGLDNHPILKKILGAAIPTYGMATAAEDTARTLVDDLTNIPGRTLGQNIGSIGGGLAGGRAFGPKSAVAGSAIGRTVGGIIGDVITGHDEDILGNIGAGAMDAAVGTGVASFPMLKGLYTNKQNERQHLANDVLNFFGSKSTLSGEQTAAMAANPSVPMTRGQVTGSQFAEDLLAPHQKAEIAIRQNEQNIYTYPNQRTPPPSAVRTQADLENIPYVGNAQETGKAGANVGLGQIAALKGQEKNLYGQAMDLAPIKNIKIAEKSVIDQYGLPSITSPASIKAIKGPITLLETGKLVDDEIAAINKQLDIIEDPGVKTQFKSLISKLRGLKDEGVVGFEEARAIKGDVYDMLKNTKRFKMTESEAGLNRLGSALNADIKFSSDMWKMPSGYKGPSASTLLERANAVTVKRFNVFDEYASGKLDKAIGTGVKFERDAFPTQLHADSFNNLDNTQKTVRAFGRRSTAQGFMNDMVDRFFKPDSNVFLGKEGLDHIKNPETMEILKQFTDKDQRQGLLRFLNRASIMDPRGKSAVGSMALRFAEGNAALSLPSDFASGGIKGIAGRNALKLTAIFGAKKFARDVLLNPVQARIAAGLISKPRANPVEIKKLLGAMGGAHIILKNETGRQWSLDTKTMEATPLDSDENTKKE